MPLLDFDRFITDRLYWNRQFDRLLVKGRPVKFGRGPAAVTGDEIHKVATVPIDRDGKAVESRRIRKPEDLPAKNLEARCGRW